jgi:vancomycin resistance protein YoaR
MRRRRRSATRSLARLAVVVLGIVVVVGLVVGFAFAGSTERVAEGIEIGGVDVGGLTVTDAEKLLARRSARLADVPVEFVAAGRVVRFTPAQLGVHVDWAEAVQEARRAGSGFGPLRGFRRLRVRLFGTEVAPSVSASRPALSYALDRVESLVGRAPRNAAVVLRGLRPEVVPARAGRRLERRAAERLVVDALAGFRRARVSLPVRVAAPSVTAAELAPVAARVRTAVSAPVRLAVDDRRFRLPRWRIAQLLDLPSGGARKLAIGGPSAERYFDRLDRAIARPARDASFAATANGSVHVVPGVDGLGLDRKSTAAALLAAAIAPRPRLAEVGLTRVEPKRTTAEAKAMGIERVLSTYTTPYAGTADRINNLQLAISLLDGTLLAPGATFSLNKEVGERTPERGFRVAPVIINGEYAEAVGGGTSQVATTVFNAAWEAGLKITERNPHALYISRYPTGRDATVNYPDLDCKFVNDTGKWLLVRGFASDSGISVSIWGPDTGRRVVSEPGSLYVTGSVPVKRVKDPTLLRGKTVVEEAGSPPRSVSVKRTVYGADGEVVHAETWFTSYRGDKRVIRVGTKKPPPKKKPKPKNLGTTGVGGILIPVIPPMDEPAPEAPGDEPLPAP